MKYTPQLEINRSQAAQYLGCSQDRIDRLIARGKIKARIEENPSNATKNRWFIDFNSLEELRKKEEAAKEL